MKWDWSVEKKNPLFYFIVVLFLGGMIMLAWGHDKNESTSLVRSRFSVPIMILGGVMIVGGFVGMFTYKKGKKRTP